MNPQQPQQTREQFVKSLFILENRDNIYSEKETKEKLVEGINKVVDVVRSSYGSSGSNCILEAHETPFHRVSNDGKMIVDSVKLSDPVENIGANIVKEVADKSDKESGDGRKTSMILLQAILKEGMKCKESPMEIKRSLDECLPIVLKNIDEQTEKITTKDIGKIAEVSSESKMLGDKFQEIYNKIGSEGIIELDNSGLSETFYTTTDGVRLLNCRFLDSYMANEDKGRKAVYDFPYVLIVKDKITAKSLSSLDAIFKRLYNDGKKELVIFCDDIDIVALSALAALHFGVDERGKPKGDAFKTLIIKAPALWKDWLFEDFAKITKATIVDEKLGRPLKSFQHDWLGYCDKIVTDKNETVVLGTQDISEHIKVLEDINTDDGRLRISRLKTKTAILKLGANSESELSYIRGKALDARNASYLALQGGVVAGAGVCLGRVSEVLNGGEIGAKILKKALTSPMGQIRENGGVNIDISIIRDPAIVVKNAITNALSVASTILTTSNVITLKK